jgi:hypothetical protein
MRLFSWLREQAGAKGPAQAALSRRSKNRPTARARPRLELLEDRCVPSTLAVTSCGDDATDKHTLRYAVANAQSGDTILLTAAVKNPIVLTNGELILSQNVTIEGVPARTPTISGGNLSRVFEVAPGASVILSDVVITGGNGKADNTAGNASAEGDGGGILVDAGASLTVNNSTLSDNAAIFYGGAVYNLGAVTVGGSTLSGNSGPFYGGAIFSSGPMSVSDSTVSGNAAVYDGGGIDNGYNQTGIITNTTVSGNSTTYYGGGISNSGTLTVEGSTVVGNSARNGGGISSAGTLIVNGSSVSDNTGRYGGGIYNYYGTVTVSACTVSGNAAQYGGGIYNDNLYGYNVLTVSGSTVSGNSATDGGGIYNLGSAAVTDSTLSGNTGGNIFGTWTDGGGNTII